MASKRLHLTLSPAQYRELQKRAEKLGMDVSNAIRHYIALGMSFETHMQAEAGTDKDAKGDQREPT